jgi:glycosyltransferase involved in cell wall biosynthesis
VVCTDPPLLSVTALLPVALKRGLLVNWIMDLFPEAATELGVLNSRSAMARVCVRLRDRSLRAASCSVAPTERMAKSLQRTLPNARFAVINHWSDGDAIQPIEPERCPLRREWGLEGKVVIGYSGNFGRAHDFGTILNAANLLRARGDIVFLLVGGGHRLGWVESKVAELALDNVIVKPLQPRERLAECLAVPDVHLVSLRPEMEPFIVPSKFYGVAAAGRPTLFIGDQNGEIASLVRAGDCGASVEIGEGAALAQRIVELAESPSERRRMGGNARALFDSAFSENRGLAEWKRLIIETTSSDSLPLPLATRGVRL